jgi:hypothetical protein
MAPALLENWHCMNRSCNAEIQLQVNSAVDAPLPRCCCGSRMKKKYTAPVFRYLDFLRLDESALVETTSHVGGEE